MINGVEVRSAFSGDVASALTLAAQELSGMGYELTKNEGGELKMKFSGKWFTTDPEKMRHKLAVRSEAGHLVFAFGTGIIASHWNDEDRQWAQARADEVVSAVSAQMGG